jgi:hypothetical protein
MTRGFAMRSKLQIAATVLSSIAHFQKPCPPDIDALRDLAESDDERTMHLDELARTVILREIERRSYLQRTRASVIP